MDDHLIDSELNEIPKDTIREIMSWWERKRLLFNLIIAGIALLALIPNLIAGTINNTLGLSFIIQSAVYLIFINCCYCAGWGIQLLRYYYFNFQNDSNALDYVLYTIGTLFTGLFTYFGFLVYLHFR